MARTQSFSGVTPRIWERVKASSIADHRTIYDPATANVGLATTATPVGKVVLAFDFRPSALQLQYTIREKPFLVSERTIWSGIQSAIERCRR